MREKLIRMIEDSISFFIINDLSLIRRHVSERTLCGAFMIELHNLLKERFAYNYHVDVEFNRSAIKAYNDIKRIPGDNGKIIIISTDLIVHGRGEFPKGVPDNLIAVEMKKYYSDTARYKCNKEKNIWRLEYLTLQEEDLKEPSRFDIKTIQKVGLYGYILGAFIEVNYKKKYIRCDIYSHGQYLNSYTSKKFDLEEK